MAELFDDVGNNDEFALPGDEQYKRDWEESTPPDTVVEPVVAAVAEEEPVAVQEPPTAAERPRGDDGRFLSKEEIAAREGAAAALPAEPQGDLILGKFKNQEELERSYQELERRFHEGRAQAGDDEQLSALAEQVAARLDQQATARQPEPQYDADALELWFDENPAQIPLVAIEAHKQGNEQLRDLAIAAWEDIDKVEAKRFERAVIVDGIRHAEQAEVSQAAGARQQWQRAAERFQEAHPDLDSYASEIQTLAAQYPDITRLLVGGTEQVQQQVLDFLYTKAKDARAANNVSAAQDLGREQALAADEAIREAAVASSTTTAVAETSSVADRIAAEWDKDDAPLTEGWQV